MAPSPPSSSILRGAGHKLQKKDSVNLVIPSHTGVPSAIGDACRADLAVVEDPDERFGPYLELVADCLDCPMVVLTVQGDDGEQVVKKADGLRSDLAEEALGLCAAALASRGPIVITDPQAESTLAGRALTQGRPVVRFAAAQAIRAASGERLGALCVLDRRKRRGDGNFESRLRGFAELLARELGLEGRLLGAQRAAELTAVYDRLTGLPGRSLLLERLQALLKQAGERGQWVAVLYLEVSDFRALNRLHGHEAGDRALSEIAQRLRDSLSDGAIVARPQGCDFVAAIPQRPDRRFEPKTVAAALIARLHEPIHLDDEGARTLRLRMRVGASIFPRHGESALTLIDKAAAAQREDGGRHTLAFFSERIDQRRMRQFQIESRLPSALEHDALQLVYQPQVSLDDGRICGLEALARWEDSELGAVSPGEFVPVAEAAELMAPIGNWVLCSAVEQCGRWRDAGMPELALTVNVSGQQLRDPSLASLVASVLEANRLSPGQLSLEVTEHSLVGDFEQASRTMHALRELGVNFYIDDFGTAYSSLDYLRRLPFAALKLDKTFVDDIRHDVDTRTVVEGLIRLAHDAGVMVIAEGVEHRKQATLLRKAGCDRIQGYCFSPPVTADEAFGLVRQRARLRA